MSGPAAGLPTGVGPNPVIEADPDPDPNAQTDWDDVDSAIGSSLSAGARRESISSSIMRFREENGRTYHAYKAGKYVVPNDDCELDRLDLQHHIFLLTFQNKLYLCPAGRDGRPLHRVLDVGTGTGIWAIDFAEDHPGSSVIGVDLSPSQPQFLPPNLTFHIDDLDEPWTYGGNFDLIYSRMMTGSIADWPRFFERAFENLRPGGWIELTDITPAVSDDGTLAPDTALYKWLNLVFEGTKLTGRPYDEPTRYQQLLKDAGFVNVTQIIYKWPMNRWPKDRKYKELGMWTLENFGGGLEGLSMALFTRVHGWSKEQTEAFLSDVRNDMSNPAIHAYWPLYVVYGQKPL